MWRPSVLNPGDILRFRNARERFDLHPLVVHTSYLINMASLDPVIRSRSIEAFRGELQRAAAIGAEYLVTHPGNYKSCSIEEGIAGFALGLRDAARGLDLAGLTVLIENTVGARSQLGGKFSELRAMRDLAAQLCGVPVGYCLDTCHLFASGFEISTAAGLETMLSAADRILGIAAVKVIHANDSKGALESRLDRHANIGEGAIGTDGFRRILQHPALRDKPFILETPVDADGDDRRNLETLKRLAAPNRQSRPRASKKKQG